MKAPRDLTPFAISKLLSLSVAIIHDNSHLCSAGKENGMRRKRTSVPWARHFSACTPSPISCTTLEYCYDTLHQHAAPSLPYPQAQACANLCYAQIGCGVFVFTAGTTSNMLCYWEKTDLQGVCNKRKASVSVYSLFALNPPGRHFDEGRDGYFGPSRAFLSLLPRSHAIRPTNMPSFDQPSGGWRDDKSRRTE